MFLKGKDKPEIFNIFMIMRSDIRNQQKKFDSNQSKIRPLTYLVCYQLQSTFSCSLNSDNAIQIELNAIVYCFLKVHFNLYFFSLLFIVYMFIYVFVYGPWSIFFSFFFLLKNVFILFFPIVIICGCCFNRSFCFARHIISIHYYFICICIYFTDKESIKKGINFYFFYHNNFCKRFAFCTSIASAATYALSLSFLSKHYLKKQLANQ